MPRGFSPKKSPKYNEDNPLDIDINNNSSGDCDDDLESLSLQVNVIKCEAAVVEKRRILRKAVETMDSIKKEMKKIKARISVLETKSWYAASNRDFKDASETSKEMNELTLKMKATQTKLQESMGDISRAKSGLEIALEDLANAEEDLVNENQSVELSEITQNLSSDFEEANTYSNGEYSPFSPMSPITPILRQKTLSQGKRTPSTESKVKFIDGNDEVEIGEGVGFLRNERFKKNKSLRKIELPSTLETIGDDTFEQCENLERVDLSNTQVKFIGRSSFKECNDLDQVKMPATLKRIGSEAFTGCSNLTEVDLSTTELKEIDEKTFSMCDKLSLIKFPKSLERIGEASFQDCKNLTTVQFSKDCKLLSIDREAFLNSGVSSMIIPSSVVSIGAEAFGNCKKLASIKISKTTRVHPSAFVGCNMLPPFMTAKISWDKEECYDSSPVSGVKEFVDAELIVEDDVKERKYKLQDTIQFVEVKEGVKHIGSSGFESCVALEAITLPKSLNSLGSCVFKGCSSLKEIVIPENVTYIEHEVFQDCISLFNVELAPATKYIYNDAFRNCSSLKTVVLPETVVDIQSSAFMNCTQLKSIKIPSVKYFGNSVFEECESLQKVEFSDGISIDKIQNRAFYRCVDLREFELPCSVKIIESDAFFECESLRSFNFHEGLTEIEDYAFAECTSIEHIRLPRSVKRIGSRCFRGCTSLRTVTFLNPDIVIGEKAFAQCEALEHIKGLTPDHDAIKDLISRKVFFGCRSLETPLLNEVHLVAEGKCWPGDDYPPNSHEWIRHELDEINGKTHSKEASSTFLLDYNGDTAFQCAVRGGAPDEFLKLLAVGTNEDGKTQLDIFAEKYAKVEAEDFTEDELDFLIEENSKLIASTPIGLGDRYLDTFEILLGSSIFDPRTVPEFIGELNRKFQTRVFAALLMFDIMVPILRVISYTHISGIYFDPEAEYYASNGWYIFIYVSVLYLIFREYIQAREGFLKWIGEYWNWVDMIVMINTLISTILMHKVDYHDTIDTPMKDYVILMTFLTFTYAVLKLRVVAVQFAVFVSGMINIISTLLPFFAVSVLVLGGFAHMYLLNDREGNYSTFSTALLYAYSDFLAFNGLPLEFDEPASELERIQQQRELRIACFFGFFVVVLLLNVVIAVASSAWDGVTERGRDDFLLYRIRLFLELQCLFDFVEPMKKHKMRCAIHPDINYIEMWKDSKKFGQVLNRIKKEGIVLIGRIFLHFFYLILGPFVLGLTWPRAVRKSLFTIDNKEAIADKRTNLISLLNDAEEDLERLEKIDKHIEQNPKHEFLHLVDVKGISSHFELKRKIHATERTIRKRKKDIQNFKIWREALKKKPITRNKKSSMIGGPGGNLDLSMLSSP